MIRNDTFKTILKNKESIQPHTSTKRTRNQNVNGLSPNHHQISPSHNKSFKSTKFMGSTNSSMKTGTQYSSLKAKLKLMRKDSKYSVKTSIVYRDKIAIDGRDNMPLDILADSYKFLVK